jgi:rubrerythrin
VDLVVARLPRRDATISPGKGETVSTGSGQIPRQPEEPISRVLEGLNDLLQLDHDSIGAYEVALEHLENAEYVSQIRFFQGDHQRHIRDLNDTILSLGGVPVNEPHASSLLKEGIQRLTAAGGDRALLTAWRANELAATRKYADYARRAAAWPARAREVVVQNAGDEERHYDWVRGVLGTEAGELPDREGVRDRLAGWRHRVSWGVQGASLRDRAASALNSAADRLDSVESGEGSGGIRERTAEGAHAAARGLHAAARGLQDSSSLDPRPVIEEEIRRNPARSLVAIFAIGFVLGRVVR